MATSTSTLPAPSSGWLGRAACYSCSTSLPNTSPFAYISLEADAWRLEQSTSLSELRTWLAVSRTGAARY